MSLNIMEMVKQAASQQIMGKLGGLLGTDQKKTSSVFESAAGAILGGLMKKGSTSKGAEEIFEMTKDHDGSTLDKLGDLLGGGDATDEYQKQGAGILDGILGSSQGGILSTLAKALGLDEGMIGKLMMMVAPMVMGVIGKHLKSKALDAVGLGNLLGEQKQHVAKWGMPASLTSSLGFGDALGNVGNSVSDAAGDARQAVTGAATDAANAGGGLMKLLIPLVIIGALIWAAITYLPGMLGGGADAIQSSMPNMEIPAGMDFGGLDTGALTSKFTSITDGFQNVTAEKAPALAQQIGDFTGSLDNLGLNNVPEASKGFVGKMFGSFTDTITKSMGGIEDEGILSILKPVIATLMEKIKTFGF
jgi:hypothetical protein